MKLLEQRSNDSCWYVFGHNEDSILTSMVPLSDDFQKWNSLCYDCHSSGSFCEFSRILCRKCRNIRRETAEKFEAARAEKEKKRVREMDSNDRELVKRALNLSLESDDSQKTRNLWNCLLYECRFSQILTVCRFWWPPNISQIFHES